MTSDTSSFAVPFEHVNLDGDGQTSLVVPGEQRPLPTLAAPLGRTPEPCEWCGSNETTGVCPRSVSCPRCGVEPGARCKRPSGHLAPELHSDRIRKAEQRSQC